jgi:hypothetical protein
MTGTEGTERQAAEKEFGQTQDEVWYSVRSEADEGEACDWRQQQTEGMQKNGHHQVEAKDKQAEQATEAREERTQKALDEAGKYAPWSAEVAELIQACWSPNAHDRPAFDEVLVRVSKFLQDAEQYTPSAALADAA